MSLFRAFHAVAYKSAGNDGSLILLRDQETDYRGIVWYLQGEIPTEICHGGKTALDYVKENGKQVAVLSAINGEAFVLPPSVAKEVETVEYIPSEVKNSNGEVTGTYNTERKVKTEVMVPGTFLDGKVEKACHKLFSKMDLIEQTRYCSIKQILALEVSATIKEQISLDVADEPEKIDSIRKEAIKTAEKNVKKQLSSSQMALLQKRLGSNGTVQKLISAE